MPTTAEIIELINTKIYEIAGTSAATTKYKLGDLQVDKVAFLSELNRTKRLIMQEAANVPMFDVTTYDQLLTQLGVDIGSYTTDG